MNHFADEQAAQWTSKSAVYAERHIAVTACTALTSVTTVCSCSVLTVMVAVIIVKSVEKPVAATAITFGSAAIVVTDTNTDSALTVEPSLKNVLRNVCCVTHALTMQDEAIVPRRTVLVVLLALGNAPNAANDSAPDTVAET